SRESRRMAARLLSVASVPLLSDDEAKILSLLARQAADIGSGLGILASQEDDIVPLRNFFFRKWVLECHLALHETPRSFGELSRALGSPGGESLAAKLEPLVTAGLLNRLVLSQRPLRVRYDLTPAGRDAAVGVFVLATAHA